MQLRKRKLVVTITDEGLTDNDNIYIQLDSFNSIYTG